MAIALTIAWAIGWPAEGATDQPWQKEYTGEQATGNRVVALWHFARGAEMVDATGKGHRLKIRGRSRIVDGGRFGSCLECFASGSGNDVKEGADTKRRADLAPAGAFTLEMWIKPKPEMLDREQVIMLADKRSYYYFKDIPRANHGYLFLLRRLTRGTFVMHVFLGFGADSASYASKPVTLAPEQWHHVAFTYDGAGTVQIFLNGAVVGSATREGRGDISPGPYPLTIGDRVASVHAGFPGYIDEVRLSKGVVPFSSGRVMVHMGARDGRTAFVRMERDVVVHVSVSNGTGHGLAPTQAACFFGGSRREIALPALGIGESYAFDLPVDTTVRPDTYRLNVTIIGTASGKPFRVEESAPIVIVPRPLPSRMPVVMRGIGDIETLKEIGFTHHLSMAVDMGKIWAEGKPSDWLRVFANTFRWLAEPSLKAGLGGATTPADLIDPPMKPWPAPPVFDWTKVVAMPDQPQVAGLIGARTALSSGSGTVADYATAAKKAGLQFIVFLEDSLAMDQAKWDQLVKACDAACDKSFIAVPGLTYEDAQGNHLYAFADNVKFPKPEWLLPDRRLATTMPMRSRRYFDYVNEYMKQHIISGFWQHRRNWVHVADYKLYNSFPIHSSIDGKPADDAFGDYRYLMGWGGCHAVLAFEIMTRPSLVAERANKGWRVVVH
ncbi:LamG domain-containing protein, partial [bacterium]|nr:LamG domain-containing protein [bacterium]